MLPKTKEMDYLHRPELSLVQMLNSHSVLEQTLHLLKHKKKENRPCRFQIFIITLLHFHRL